MGPRIVAPVLQDKSQDRGTGTKDSHAGFSSFTPIPDAEDWQEKRCPVIYLTFAGRRLWRCGRRRFNSVCTQGAVDHQPDLLCGNCAVDAFAIDKESRRSIDAQRFRFFGRCAHLGLILLCDAGVELGAIQLRQRAFIAGNAIQTPRSSWSGYGLRR